MRIPVVVLAHTNGKPLMIGSGKNLHCAIGLDHTALDNPLLAGLSADGGLPPQFSVIHAVMSAGVPGAVTPHAWLTENRRAAVMTAGQLLEVLAAEEPAATVFVQIGEGALMVLPANLIESHWEKKTEAVIMGTFWAQDDSPQEIFEVADWIEFLRVAQPQALMLFQVEINGALLTAPVTACFADLKTNKVFLRTLPPFQTPLPAE